MAVLGLDNALSVWQRLRKFSLRFDRYGSPPGGRALIGNKNEPVCDVTPRAMSGGVKRLPGNETPGSESVPARRRRARVKA